MAFFKRRPPAGTAVPDEALPFFTRAQADRFRAIQAAAFAQQGVEVEVRPDHLVDSSGREFGLHNSAAACFNAERGEQAWGELASNHASRVLAVMDRPSELELRSTEEVRAHVFPRLVEVQSLAPLPVGYSVEFSDGVVEVLNLDLPDSVLVLNDDHVARHGGRAGLRASGIRNLLSVLDGLRVELLSEGEAAQLVVMGDSMFTASSVLVMPELLARIGIGRAEHGVLVCMPFRHQVAVHEIRDASVVPSLNAMVGFAHNGYEEGAGPLTPHVFWWCAGSFEQLTQHHDNGIAINVGPDFQAVLEQVCD